MSRSARRLIAVVTLTLFLVSTVSGCMTVQRTAFSPAESVAGITGVTTRSGTQIPLARPGATIASDTLYAIGRQGQVILPTDSVAQVWDRKLSAGRTAGLVVGVGAGLAAALIAIAAISFEHSWNSLFSPQ